MSNVFDSAAASAARLSKTAWTKLGGDPVVRAAALLLAGGALVGGVATANALAARKAERRRPAKGAFVEIDGVQVHYLEKGEGDPIVLIHGNGVTAEDWVLSGVFDRLAKSHRVVAFDRPGFGYSGRPRTRIWTAGAQAELLYRAMGELGVGSATVVGHSWGTLVAMAMATAHPASVSKLVLMSGYYVPTPRPDIPMMSGPAIPVVGDLIRYTVSPLLGWLTAPLLFKLLFSPAKVTARFKAGFPLALALRPSQIRASAADTALMLPEAVKTLSRRHELKMPVLIMAGAGDKIVSFKRQSEHLSHQIVGSRLHAFEGAGHMIHHIAPDEVAASIQAVEPPAQAAA